MYGDIRDQWKMDELERKINQKADDHKVSSLQSEVYELKSKINSLTETVQYQANHICNIENKISQISILLRSETDVYYDGIIQILNN